MLLSIISDEISRDPLTACELAAAWGLRHIELRTHMLARAPLGMSDAQMAAVRKTAASCGLDIPSISPGLFKLRLDDPAISEHRGELRQRGLDLAEAVGATTIVVFPHLRPEGVHADDGWPTAVVEDLRETGELAAQRGVQVALETEAPCYGASGPSMARLVATIDHPAVGVNWDPANCYTYNGQDHREGYAAVRDQVVHVHVKDQLARADGQRQRVAPGEGAVGWAEQIRSLHADGYEGLVVVETHFGPKVAASERCVRAVQRLLAEAGVEAR